MMDRHFVTYNQVVVEPVDGLIEVIGGAFTNGFHQVADNFPGKPQAEEEKNQDNEAAGVLPSHINGANLLFYPLPLEDARFNLLMFRRVHYSNSKERLQLSSTDTLSDIFRVRIWAMLQYSQTGRSLPTTHSLVKTVLSRGIFFSSCFK